MTFYLKIAHHLHNHLQIEFVSLNESKMDFRAIFIPRRVLTPPVLVVTHIFATHSIWQWVTYFLFATQGGSFEVDLNKEHQSGRLLLAFQQQQQ